MIILHFGQFYISKMTRWIDDKLCILISCGDVLLYEYTFMSLLQIWCLSKYNCDILDS